MRLILDQHLYTDRLNVYATVGETPGIDQILREEIQKRVQSPPGADGTICRCYPLRGGALAGLSFVAIRYGARPSHIAHTYVVDTPQLARAGWNLPWIALHLPFWKDYRPSAQGIARLEPMEIDIERGGQLRMLRWLRAIVPEPDLVRHWHGGLLAAIANGQTIQFSFGDAANLVEGTRDILGLAAAPSRPDVLNLWRTAGLLALIPAIFQERLSVAINETGGAELGLAITLAAGTPTRFPEVGGQVYLDHCFALLERGEDVALQAFQDDVGAFVSDYSVRGLEAAARYRLALVDSLDPEEQAAQILALWDVSKTVTQASIEAAMAVLRKLGLGSETKRRLLEATAGKALSEAFADTSLPRDIFEMLLAWDAAIPVQQVLLRGLPRQAKQVLWRLAERLWRPPAALVGSLDLERTAIWTDALFSGLTLDQQRTAVQNLVEALWEIGSWNLGTATRLLIEDLGDVLGPGGDLSSRLVSQVAEKISKWSLDVRSLDLKINSLSESDPFEAILKHAIGSERRIRLGALLGAELAHRFWNNEPARVQDYILDLPKSPDMDSLNVRRQLCQEIRSRTNDRELRKLANVQYELLTVLLGESLIYASDDRRWVCINLPAYEDWLNDCKPKSNLLALGGPLRERRRYTKFHENLKRIVQRWPVLDAMCIALSYLYANSSTSDSTTDLYNALMIRTCHPDNISEVKGWLSDSGRASQTPMSGALSRRVSPWAMLALFVGVLETRNDGYSYYHDAAWKMLSEVVHHIGIYPEKHRLLKDCFKHLGVSTTLLRCRIF